MPATASAPPTRRSTPSWPSTTASSPAPSPPWTPRPCWSSWATTAWTPRATTAGTASRRSPPPSGSTPPPGPSAAPVRCPTGSSTPTPTGSTWRASAPPAPSPRSTSSPPSPSSSACPSPSAASALSSPSSSSAPLPHRRPPRGHSDQLGPAAGLRRALCPRLQRPPASPAPPEVPPHPRRHALLGARRPGDRLPRPPPLRAHPARNRALDLGQIRPRTHGPRHPHHAALPPRRPQAARRPPALLAPPERAHNAAPSAPCLPAARAAGLLGLGPCPLAPPPSPPPSLAPPNEPLPPSHPAHRRRPRRRHPASSSTVRIRPSTAHVRLLRRPAPATLVKLVPVALHAISLGSNSFTVWEDHVVPHLLAFAVVLPALVRGIGAPKPALRNRLLVFGLLFAICVRLIGLSTVCREEQHGGCSVTFYGSDTSSSAPAWVMSLAIPLAIGLPIVPAWFLGISDSYRGPASFFFGGLWRLALLCAVQHAISDYLLATHAPSMAASLAETAGWVKLLAARAAVVLSVLAGSIVWLILPVCIDVQRVEPEEAAAEKPRLLVIGFANVYGSSYLMFLAAVFAILFLVTPPTGQLVLGLALVAVLALVELNDAFVDLAALEHALPNAVRSAATHNTPSGPALVPPCDLNMLTGLYLLGHLVFFGTGHQATFASVQWNAAFVGLTQAHPLLSPILVFLNSFAGFVLVVLALPLFGLWKFEPVINLHPPTEQRGGAEVRTLETQLVESQLTFLALQALLLLLNMLFIFHLRRHLMVWKVFSPRFILAAAALLASHILLLLGFNAFAWPALRSKVRRAFGPQLLA
ncbi:hypothetical protein PTTG_28368 [Puccinia triticina 1-1 BBBD Race 1]|uniref:GPI ethanolamine phosphate transferase 2 C-terminal domain-containing protein n=1 Tax=Puccinia triticina (isolate 1-1 / race 1 (BBBD)) TaxID=630390 RepID=A0A180GEG9_PUCT1|nr:hypothetical protein PTTG_28368 [Puccinia triticina 1-1 BBBD Race 1]